MNFPTAPDSAWLSARVSIRFAPPQLRAIDHWQVTRHLGSGSTAQIWLMQHTSGAHYVACKTPKSQDDVVTLSQEAELADTLSHENIIQNLNSQSTLELPTTDPTVGTFWEYLPAGSLGNLIAATGKIGLAQTVTILLPMIQVAQYLQSQQIVHGDISPRNILFDLSGRPVLIDLGSTRASAHSFDITGTPGFIAPELDCTTPQVEGLGASADVYSLAAVGWFCLTGRIPGPTVSRLPMVSLNDAVDHNVVDLLEACLSDEPVLRPSIEQMLSAVSYWAVPEPVDLFAAVGEEHELLLPTRKPGTVAKQRNRPFWRRGQTVPAVKAKNKILTTDTKILRRRRLLLGLGAVVLSGGVVATMSSTLDDQHQTPEEHTSSTEQNRLDTDFQAVLDELAKARSAAWTLADAELVETYAVAGSSVFAEDAAILNSLADSANLLDGIRMRAEVESVEPTSDGATVVVQWRTDGYVQLDSSGMTVDEFQSRAGPIHLTLEETPAGWKIADTSGL